MKQLSHYTIECLLGQGATAQVYSAVRGDERVALKVFHEGLWDKAELRRRALSEVRAVSALSHPGIVRVIETLFDQQPPAIALEFIDGEPLDRFQARLPYILPELGARIVIDVLDALVYAHANGTIHRDLKPANILVSREGRIVISDFGLTKLTDVSQLTVSGTILGSPDFMAPEQARGESATARSDVFAVAAVLYFLVTGTRPFARQSPLATLAAVCDAQPEPPQRRNPKLSASLAAIILKGLAKNPTDRFATAAAFAEALRTHLATVGLVGEEFDSLRDWLADPSSFVLRALTRMADTLTVNAEAAIERGDWDSALGAISHLGSVAPEGAAIERLMASYEKHRRRRRLLAYWVPSAALLPLVAIGWAGYANRPRGNPEASAASPATAVREDRIQTRAAAPTRPAPVAKARPASAGPKNVGEVRIDVPRDIQVFWDGRPIKAGEKLRAQTVGPHRLRLEKAGHPPITQEINVRADEPTVIQVQ